MAPLQLRYGSSGPPASAVDFIPVLSAVRYVDGATSVPSDEQDGSQAAPFTTLQGAIDSLAGQPGTLYINPGTYAEAVTISASIQFIGLTSNRLAPTISITSITASGSASVSLYGIQAVGTVTTSTGQLIAFLSQVTTSATLGGALTVTQCTIGAITCTQINQALTTLFTGAITLTNSASSGVSRFSAGCRFQAAADITGPGGSAVVTFDGESRKNFASVSNTVTSAAVSVLNQLPSALVSFTVPVLAAGAIGEASSASLASTELGGIAAGAGVHANPDAGGVAGGGAVIQARVSATNVVTLTFLGPTTGGAENFLLTQLA